ncbi:hypothetical protein HLH33_14490, partial [Gluconacetobacter diazotrophicus]|nr:hypothetical protein [Gluconacetobacter diazotrophicus]
APARAAPPVEPPPAAAPRPSVRAPLDEGRPMPWHDRPAAPAASASPLREPPFFPPPEQPVPPRADRERPDDEWGNRRPRSEPTLRWPPRN